MAKKRCVNNMENDNASYFDGRLLGQIGTGILMLFAFLLPLLPAGGLWVLSFTFLADLSKDILIAIYALIGVFAFFMLWLGSAWATVVFLRWQYRHTVIDGYRLVFTGKAVALWGKLLKWLFLIVITLTIYGLWVWIKMQKWVMQNVHIAEREEWDMMEQSMACAGFPMPAPYFPAIPYAPARYMPTPYPPQPQMSYYPTYPYTSPCSYAHKRNKKRN